MPFIIALWLLALAPACKLGTGTSARTDWSAAQSSHAVWIDVPFDTPVFRLDSRAGKLVPVSTASEIGKPAADPSDTALEYLAESADWIWVDSIEAPRFVKRSAVAQSPYADNPSHSYLRNHSAQKLAHDGLPVWLADARGACPEYGLAASGRLEPVPARLREADVFSSPDLTLPDSIKFNSVLDDYVLGNGLVFTSNHCLGSHELQAARFDRIADYFDRDAVVLGAGSVPLIEERGTFLMLLAQNYRTVYVNDIRVDQWISQELINKEYASRCPSGKPTDAADMPYLRDDFCSIVTQAPTNLDFRLMGMPAHQIPANIVSGTDIFVIFPEPSWVWGKTIHGEDAPHSLGQDLSSLLDASSTAYIVTEQPIQYDSTSLIDPPRGAQFSSEGLEITEIFGASEIMDAYEGGPQWPTLSFSTQSKRYITALSPLMPLMDYLPFYTFRISKLR